MFYHYVVILIICFYICQPKLFFTIAKLLYLFQIYTIKGC
ncbi:hypothetical protein BFAG_03243 [Bacteroides fragilis 3_1_12]|uniref:Uncharacterized protein n=1 Tax=Bacteroides fragilis 3_1_12 TaxID=457424 RepID=A0ABN0BNR1_BACFG|nr:hypothetical protein BFAG_03243 [Bacteroides fragilis 3_1_12]